MTMVARPSRMKIQCQPFGQTIPPHEADAVGKNAAEGTRQCRGAEEERYAELSLAPLVPHGEVVHHSGKQAGLGDAEEEAGNEEACQVCDDTEQRGDDAPSDREGRQPESRGRAFEDNVARDLRGASHTLSDL